jgi:hypothetical protein
MSDIKRRRGNEIPPLGETILFYGYGEYWLGPVRAHRTGGYTVQYGTALYNENEIDWWVPLSEILAAIGDPDE